MKPLTAGISANRANIFVRTFSTKVPKVRVGPPERAGKVKNIPGGPRGREAGVSGRRTGGRKESRVPKAPKVHKDRPRRITDLGWPPESRQGPTRAGRKQQSPFGLLKLHGPLLDGSWRRGERVPRQSPRSIASFGPQQAANDRSRGPEQNPARPSKSTRVARHYLNSPGRGGGRAQGKATFPRKTTGSPACWEGGPKGRS